MKKTILFAAAITLVLNLSAFAVSPPPSPESPPNIVFIMADDLGYGDIGCFGATDIKTPHIDRICEEGIKVTDFHVHPRCTPTRAALLTGCYANRTGVSRVIYSDDKFGLNPKEVTLPELLQKKGYRTGIVGKWHLGDWEPFLPVNHGFDSQFIRLRVQDDEKMKAAQGNVKKQRAAYSYRYNKNGELSGDASQFEDRTKRYTENAIEFIRESKDQPFFFYFAHNIPHTPLQPSENFKGSSSRGQYGDVVQEMDWSVGEVLKTLDELKLAENTLVIFCSDNGPQIQYRKNITGGTAGSLRDGKWTTFEGGTRTPFVARWLGKIKPGSECDDLIGIIDMLPTFCSLVGMKVPTDRVIDGVDMSASLLGQSPEGARETFAYFDGGGCYAFRYKQWKLFIRNTGPSGSNAQVVKTGPVKAGELFNLINDRAETTDVSAENPELSARIKKMADEFLADFEKNTRQPGRVE